MLIQRVGRKGGIRVAYLDRREAETLLVSKNSGNQLLSVAGFAENCRVPREDWLPLPADEFEALLSPCAALHSEAVTILKIEFGLLDEFHETVLPAIVGSSDPNLTRRLIGGFSERVLEDLNRRYQLCQSQERGVELNFSPAGSSSTAFNFETRRFMGLHIDNHERLPLMARGQAFQLLNINLGRTSRYFCFVDHTVPALVDMLKINEEEFEVKYRHHTSRVKDLFLDQYADYPILRVEIAPGTAYIATTQNLIHDGATNKEGYDDISLLISGRFMMDDMET